MRYLLALLAVAAAFAIAACPQTTSPSVPKSAIERAADTKIPDADTSDGEPRN
ncbi:MAG: hypothetical protein ABUL62_15810 [Myxococcales bacterium]